ncbi:membrane protein insertase YidC [Mycoplasma simbae]|uniref:membrane protein insertase YidC n=1 Tax=Mycoplasma simbae TaxID=36744 RepID=UPI00069115FD|nr:membrane protein insertase YidC [Mycoplasma simbae]
MENRSKNFDYFKHNQNPKQSKNKKEIWKKVWLVVKIVLYILLFALTMAGCIQTMVVKSSNFTGAGTEYYQSKEHISPTVASFKRAKAPKNDNNLLVGEYYEIFYSPETNYHLAYKNHADVIESLRSQTSNDGGEYGKSGGFSASVQYLDQKGELVHENQPILKADKESRHLFIASSATKYESVYNQWTQIKVLDPDFKFENLFEKTESGYTIKPDALKLTHPENSGLVLKKASLFNIYSDQDGLSSIPARKFARDVLEFLYRETFLDSENYYARVMTSGDTYESLMTSIIDGSKTSLTSEQYDLLFNYNKVLKTYLENTKLDKTGTYLPLLDKEGVQKYGDAGEKLYSTIAAESSVLGGPNVGGDGAIPFAATEPQIPFYSFASTWSYGPFFSFVIYPIAALTVATRTPLPNAAGWSTFLVLVLAVVITRLVALAITWKATMSQALQEELRAKKAKIDAKYADFKNNKEMRQRQQQEVADLYKKNGISPMDSILSLIISFPIFIAMWRVIQSVPEMKSTHWLGFDFAALSWRRLLNHGEWWYLFLLLAATVTQVLSMLVPRILNKRKTKHLTIEQKQALRKSDRMQWIMMAVFLFITLIFVAGVQVYWVITNVWSILQAIAIHYFKKSKFYKARYGKKLIA